MRVKGRKKEIKYAEDQKRRRRKKEKKRKNAGEIVATGEIRTRTKML